METMRLHTVKSEDMRRFLNDLIPQGTEATYNTIDFIADFFEDKHDYYWAIQNAFAKLGLRVERADGKRWI
jgi:hypothetical protein